MLRINMFACGKRAGGLLILRKGSTHRGIIIHFNTTVLPNEMGLVEEEIVLLEFANVSLKGNDMVLTWGSCWVNGVSP